MGGLRARATGAAEPRRRGRAGDRLADRDPEARLRDARVQNPARGRRAALRQLAADRRCDRVVWDLPRAPRRRRHPDRAAVPGRAAVPLERAQRLQGRLRGRLPGRRARLRGPRRPRTRAAPRRGAGRRPRDPVGHGLRGPGHRGGAGVDLRGGVGAVRRSGEPAHASDPRRRHAGLPPLLRDISGVADVRGARLRRARADGQLRRRELGADGRLGAHGRAALPAQRGQALLPAFERSRRRGHPRVSRDRAPDRRSRRD